MTSFRPIVLHVTTDTTFNFLWQHGVDEIQENCPPPPSPSPVPVSVLGAQNCVGLIVIAFHLC